jgi:hypothetical protein
MVICRRERGKVCLDLEEGDENEARSEKRNS